MKLDRSPRFSFENLVSENCHILRFKWNLLTAPSLYLSSDAFAAAAVINCTGCRSCGGGSGSNDVDNSMQAQVSETHNCIDKSIKTKKLTLSPRRICFDGRVRGGGGY